jgi:hypothetical protein
MFDNSRIKHPGDQHWISRLLFCFVVLMLILATGCSQSVEKSTAVASNDPDQLLRQMSDHLGRAKTLSFKVNRILDPALTEGRDVADNAQIEISVSRPGKFLAKSVSKDDVRQLFFDGQNVSIYDESMKLYSTVPVAGTIDQAVAKIDETYGFTPPLAEFILSNPYQALSGHINNKSYKGKESVAGVECHHLTLSGEEADSDLWIGTADLLPRKLVATFRNREGNPKLQAEFSSWNLTPTIDEKMFAFVAPKDAEKIEMVTEAQMQQVSDKDDGTPDAASPKSAKPTGKKGT